MPRPETPTHYKRINTKIQQTAHAAAFTKNAITHLPRNHKKTPGARIPQKKKQEPEATTAEARAQYINRKKTKSFISVPRVDKRREKNKQTNKQATRRKTEV
jgi:hypothetical protein